MPEPQIDDAFRRQLEGYSLTTANILYRMPDRPVLLQSYLWQDWDMAPKFPELERFLAFWERELDGPIHSVEVAHVKMIGPNEWKRVDGIFRLH
ncbi:usg protein [Pinisolibacter sp.]|uniref:usg protein n=1 Tax=Pinisolibacter sp. TaxID=2172024 RepID=UPI002FDD43B0